MKYILILFIGMLPWSTWAGDSGPLNAGVILKSGIPCFYSLTPIDQGTPLRAGDSGVFLNVIDNNTNQYTWSTIFKARPTQAISPGNCIPYGTMSQDKHEEDISPHPLNVGIPYEFVMNGTIEGWQTVSFCISKDSHGGRYLSQTTNNRRACSTEQLIQKNSTDSLGLWGKILLMMPWILILIGFF